VINAVPRLPPAAFDALLDSGVVAVLIERRPSGGGDDVVRSVRDVMLLWSMLNFGNVPLFEHVVARYHPYKRDSVVIIGDATTTPKSVYPWDITKQLAEVREHANTTSNDQGTLAALRFILSDESCSEDERAELIDGYKRRFAETLRLAPLELLVNHS
jgi:hypothetical protein